jgi:hypothetical protein
LIDAGLPLIGGVLGTLALVRRLRRKEYLPIDWVT